jgi:poly(A) polymerase
LEKGIVKFVGEPFQRIKEDYLRVLRFFRFLARFGMKNIDKPSYKASIDNACNLQKISKERRTRELLKLLGAKYAKDVIMALNKEQVLKHIGVPFILLNQDIEAVEFKIDDPIVNLAMLIALSDNENKTCIKQLDGCLALSKKERKDIKSLTAFNFKTEFEDQHHYRYYYDYGKDLYLRFLFVCNNIRGIAKYKQYSDEVLSDVKHVLPVGGDDICALGYKGIVVGEILKKLKNHWHKNKNKLSKDELLDFIE